ncbi:MAG: Gx transporter family protein [Spirochaetaceae bacterium]|jgi:heptaprenyl diphosphate synthase|nr:Gx transporter family protein [Spirochaetaceae bacterium]
MVRPPKTVAEAGLAALAALSLFLSTVEYMIPKPLPFIRLGLANAPLLIALRLPPYSFFLLVFVKILGQALISGTLFSYIFLLSLSGTALSATAMYLLRRAVPEKYMSLAGISVTGALVSNLTQIALARVFFLGPGALYIMPPFLAMGIISGAALGLFCRNFTASSRWYNCDPAETGLPAQAAPTRAAAKPKKRPLLDTAKTPPAPLFAAGLLLSALMLSVEAPQARFVLFVVFLLAAFVTGKAGNIFFTFIFFTMIVLFNALLPYGRVICRIGVFSLTEGALLQGIGKAATVEGLVMLSRVTVSPRLRLPGRAGGLFAEAFTLLNSLLEKKKSIHAKSFISDIDRILCEIAPRRRSA